MFIWSTWAKELRIYEDKIWKYCREGELVHIPSYKIKFLVVQENHCKTKGYIRDYNSFCIITNKNAKPLQNKNDG